VLRHLRYTPVAVIPGLVAPLVVWPAATGGETDPARRATAVVALAAGYLTKNIVWGLLAACGSPYVLQNMA